MKISRATAKNSAAPAKVFVSRLLSALFFASLSVIFIFTASFVSATVDIEKISNLSNLDLSVPFKQCRAYKTNGTAFVSTASDNTKIFYLLLSNGNLDLVEARELNKIWTTDLGGQAATNAVFGAKEIFVVVKNGENFFLKSIGKDAGVTVWQKKIESETSDDDSQARLSLYKDKLILSGTDSTIRAYDAVDGSLSWNTNLETSPSDVVLLAGNKFISAASENKLTILSADKGEKLRELDTAAPITALDSETGDKVFLGARDGSVSLVDTVNKTVLWSRHVGGAQISGVTQTKDGLLVSSFDNFLYFLSENSGKRIWKRRLSGRIARAPSVSGRYAVAPTLFDSSAAIIDLKTGKIVNRINLEADDYFNEGVLFGENRIIAPTAKGLAIFTPSFNGC